MNVAKLSGAEDLCDRNCPKLLPTNWNFSNKCFQISVEEDTSVSEDQDLSSAEAAASNEAVNTGSLENVPSSIPIGGNVAAVETLIDWHKNKKNWRQGGGDLNFFEGVCCDSFRSWQRC